MTIHFTFKWHDEVFDPTFLKLPILSNVLFLESKKHVSKTSIPDYVINANKMNKGQVKDIS